MDDLKTTWTIGLLGRAGVPIHRQDAIDAVSKILARWHVDAHTIVDCCEYWRAREVRQHTSNRNTL